MHSRREDASISVRSNSVGSLQARIRIICNVYLSGSTVWRIAHNHRSAQRISLAFKHRRMSSRRTRKWTWTNRYILLQLAARLPPFPHFPLMELGTLLREQRNRRACYIRAACSGKSGPCRYRRT